MPDLLQNNGILVPQHLDPTAEPPAYEALEGEDGGSYVVPLNSDGTRVSPATEDKQDAAIAQLEAIAGLDFATQTTLAAVLAKLSADPATQTTLASVLAALQGTLTTQ